MTNATDIVRDTKIDDKVLNYIVENMPNNGYATVANKLGMENRQLVRDEIVRRKPLHNNEIVDACLALIEFVKGEKYEEVK